MPCSRRSSMSPNREASGVVALPWRCHASQRRPDARRELLRDHRLGDVVVGARLETRHHVVGVGLGGDHDDRHDALGAQRPADVEARHVGQAQIEQHEIGRRLPERRQTVGAVGGLADLVALVLQRQRQGQADPVVVFDEQQRSPCAVASVAPFVTISPALLPKSHTSRNGPSHRSLIMITVHAAPVRYLPPPGASPAAGEPASARSILGPATLCPVARRRTLRLRTGSPVLRVHRAAGRRRPDRGHLRLRPQQPARRGHDRGAASRRSSTPIWSANSSRSNPTTSESFFDDELRTDPDGFAVLNSIDPGGDRAPCTDLRHPITRLPRTARRAVRARSAAAIQNQTIDGTGLHHGRRLHRRVRHRLLRGISARRTPSPR